MQMLLKMQIIKVSKPHHHQNQGLLLQERWHLSTLPQWYKQVTKVAKATKYADMLQNQEIPLKEYFR